jgi:hypothetical protein
VTTRTLDPAPAADTMGKQEADDCEKVVLKP